MGVMLSPQEQRDPGAAISGIPFMVDQDGNEGAKTGRKKNRSNIVF